MSPISPATTSTTGQKRRCNSETVDQVYTKKRGLSALKAGNDCPGHDDDQTWSSEEMEDGNARLLVQVQEITDYGPAPNPTGNVRGGAIRCYYMLTALLLDQGCRISAERCPGHALCARPL